MMRVFLDVMEPSAIESFVRFRISYAIEIVDVRAVFLSGGFRFVMTLDYAIANADGALPYQAARFQSCVSFGDVVFMLLQIGVVFVACPRKIHFLHGLSRPYPIEDPGQGVQQLLRVVR